MVKLEETVMIKEQEQRIDEKHSSSKRNENHQLLFFEGHLNSMFRAFCHNHTPMTPHFNIIPRVNAAEESDTSQTTMEKLVQSKPSTLLVVSDSEVLEHCQNETGMDRLRIMFSKDDKGDLSPDLALPINMAKSSGAMTFFIAAVLGAKNAKEKFVAKNKPTKFETKFKAARAYNDAMFFGGIRNGVKYGLKTGIFAGMFMLTSQTLAVYRNKSTMLEYILAGFLTGGILRLNLGIKGFVGGGFIGTVVGLLGGGMMLVLLKSGNETQEQRHYWRIHETIRKEKEMKIMFGNQKQEELSAGEQLPQ